MRWDEGVCRETSASCEARGFVLELGECVLSPEARAQKEAEERRRDDDAAYARAKGELRALTMNVASDDKSIYELSVLSSGGADRMNISLDAAQLLGAMSLSLNLRSDPQGFSVSTAGLSFEGEMEGGGTLGFGFYYPFGGGSLVDFTNAFESKRLSAFGDRWRWDSDRVSLTLPMSVAAPLKGGAWDMRLAFTPVVAFGASGAYPTVDPSALTSTPAPTTSAWDAAWAGVEDPSGLELYTQTTLSLSRLVGRHGSLVGLRYQAHYSVTAPSSAAQGAWAPYLHLRFGEAVALKLEGLFYSDRPTLAALKELDNASFRAALWFNTDRGSQSEELCKTTLYTGVTAGVIYGLYKGAMALYDSSDDSSSDESDGGSVALYTLGYIALLTLPSVLIGNADDICD